MEPPEYLVKFSGQRIVPTDSAKAAREITKFELLAGRQHVDWSVEECDANEVLPDS